MIATKNFIKDGQIYTVLNNGTEMPLLGLGVYDIHGEEAVRAIANAIQAGYRLIDTATSYNNEKETGEGIRSSGINRKEIFVTTKIPNPLQGYDSTLRAFDESMKQLNIEYVDLYMVHWPIKHKRKDTWKALEKLYGEKRVKAIGVANYLIPFLEELASYGTIVPAVNQVEFSPYLYLKDLLQYCNQRNIQLQAYTPLIRGQKFKDPRLIQLAQKYGKSPAQLILRWNMQHEVSAIPKSANPVRLKENLDIFDFNISEPDMLLMDSFNEELRVVDDPMAML